MIIVKGRARADGGQLATYLLSKGDNDYVHLLDMRGLAGRDLRAGLRLAEVEAELTEAKKPLWHAQINPAEGVTMTREQQLMAVSVLEKRLGLQDLPRAVVVHHKDGREHIHVAWSRYDRETEKLRRDSFSKMKNVAAAAEIALRLGLTPNPNPFADIERERQTMTRAERRQRTKQAATHAEQQQKERTAKPRQTRKNEITAMWNASDNGQAFRSAVETAGYTLAQGKRGLVVVDQNAESHSVARQVDGVTAKDVRAKLADLDLASIPLADDIQASMRQAQQERAAEIAKARKPEPAHPTNGGAKPFEPDPLAMRAAWAELLRTFEKPTQAVPQGPEAPSRPEPKSEPEAALGEIQQPKTAADVLADLTRHHSTFTKQDLARAVDKETGGGGHQPWMMQTGGLDALNDDAKASAERSYAKWAADNPELSRKYGVARYVAYAQDQQAKRDSADPDALKARQDSKQAFDKLMAEVDALPELVRFAPDSAGKERFTSRDMLHTEMKMKLSGDLLAGRAGHKVDPKIRGAVPDLDKLGTEQRVAYDHIMAEGDLTLVVGFAGTGKSRMLSTAREGWEAAGYRVRGAALSGIAAESLQNDAGISSRTLASMIYRLDTIEEREAAIRGVEQKLDALREADGPAKGHGRGTDKQRAYLAAKRTGMVADLNATRLTDRDILVIDEAGMVGTRDMERVLTAAEKAGAKVVLVGDHEQLQAVDAGAAFRALRDRHKAAEITEVRRQAEDWQRDATKEFGQAKTVEALSRYETAGLTHKADTRDDAMFDLVDRWADARKADGEVKQIILAYTRADVAELNTLARNAYRQEGRLQEDVSLETASGRREFASGDRLYFTKNDMRMGVKNGSLGTIDKIDGDRVTVGLDTGRSVEFDVKDYGHIAHGYAATMHKSQGVTVDRAYVLASRYMDRHAAYVGMTRHRERADLYYGADEFKDFDAVSKRLARNGSKDTTLDYLRQAARGDATDSLRAAVRDFYQRERPDAPPPSWTYKATPKQEVQATEEPKTQKERSRPLSTAETMTARRNEDEAHKKPDHGKFGDDRLSAWRANMTPEQRATFDKSRQQQEAAQRLRQALGHKQDIGGPKL